MSIVSFCSREVDTEFISDFPRFFPIAEKHEITISAVKLFLIFRDLLFQTFQIPEKNGFYVHIYPNFDRPSLVAMIPRCS